MGVEFGLWVVAAVIALQAIVADILMGRGKDPDPKSAMLQAGYYAGVAMGFALIVWAFRGMDAAICYTQGYVTEYMLSVDNIFVIGVILSAFRITDGREQRSVLMWGIIGAVVLRGIFIAVGAAMIERFEILLPLMGMFLIYTGGKMAAHKESDHEEPMMVRWAKKAGIPAFLAAIIAVEGTDLIFAVDSIPAIFSITTDFFLVVTSNLMAILGLRSMFFALQGMKGLRFLEKTIAAILVLVGIKALLPAFHVHVPSWLGCIVTLGAFALGVWLSLKYPLPEEVVEKAQTTEIA